MAAKLNREALQKVRDHIAKLPDSRFDMRAYFGTRQTDDDGCEWVRDARLYATNNRNAAEGSCGSCACIAGHALAALEPDEPIPFSVMDRAAELLGLTHRRAGRLFEPRYADDWFADNHSLSDVTKPQALAVLDGLIATGRIDWRKAMKAKSEVQVSPPSHVEP